jgi:hypothetical protein
MLYCRSFSRSAPPLTRVGRFSRSEQLRESESSSSKDEVEDDHKLETSRVRITPLYSSVPERPLDSRHRSLFDCCLARRTDPSAPSLLSVVYRCTRKPLAFDGFDAMLLHLSLCPLRPPPGPLADLQLARGRMRSNQKAAGDHHAATPEGMRQRSEGDTEENGSGTWTDQQMLSRAAAALEEQDRSIDKASAVTRKRTA